MNRPVLQLSAALVALGAGIFLWKVVGLRMPVVPSGAQNVWRVEVEIDVRATGQHGSISVRLPTSGRRQDIYDESASSGGLDFMVRTEDGQRWGVWRGAVEGAQRVSHGFRVRLTRDGDLATPLASPVDLSELTLSAEPGLPVSAPAVRDALDRLQVRDSEDAAGRMRQIVSFVTEEIETVPGATRDALLTLSAREGSVTGKARLLVTLLRTAGIPARLVAGLRLAAPREEREIVYAEARLEGAWVPLLPTLDVVGRLPSDMLVLRRDGTSLVGAVGVDALTYRYRVVREELAPEELVAVMLPPNRFFTFFSLYRLPVTTQAALRVMLIVPLAVLIVAMVRNLIGLTTFGTFLPILIPLSLRDADLLVGLAMVIAVLLAGFAGRVFLDRFRLLFVPRLCILLCMVILVLVGMALLGYTVDSRDLLTGALFPIVILAMLIERFSITVSEEGGHQAFRTLGATMIVVLIAYPLFHTPLIAHLMLGFPELIFCVMGVLVWIGGYTGYRLSELIRFRALAMLAPEDEL